MRKVEAAIKPADGAEYAELIVDKENMLTIPSETVWAKIGDDGQLEVLRWDLIEVFAAEYDSNIKNRGQTHVMCKLLVLVRDQARKDGA